MMYERHVIVAMDSLMRHTANYALQKGKYLCLLSGLTSDFLWDLTLHLPLLS